MKTASGLISLIKIGAITTRPTIWASIRLSIISELAVES